MKNEEQRFATLPAEELPPGWTLATIGKMVDTDGVFTDGDWVVSKDQDPDGDVRLIQLADIGDGFWVNKSSRYLTYEKAIELGCTFLEPGDVLIARMPDPLGRACIFPGDPKRCITAVDVCIVRTGDQCISHRWLMHTINSPVARVVIESLQSGSTRKRISRKNLGRIDFPLPPSPEQRRIVAEIETQFTRLNAGVAALGRAQANLKRYRASVLKAACEGQLVPTEAELARTVGAQHAAPRQYEPAGQLLARILAERRARWEAENPSKKYKELASPDVKDLPDLPEGWAVASMDQLTTLITSGPRHWSKYYDKGDGVFLMAQNVRPGKLDLSYRKLVDPPLDDSSRERSQVNKGDLLVTIVGANTGDICQVPRELPKHYVCQSVALMRPFDSTLSDFLALYLTSPENGQRQYRRYIYGAGRPHLKFDELRMTAIMLPPLAEQHRIVAEVERRLSVVAALEAEVEAALARAARLRQSILKRAFEGKLVPQDPDDEPAAVLLERIQAERKAPTEEKGRHASGWV